MCLAASVSLAGASFPVKAPEEAAIREVKDGILRFGLKYDPALTGEATLNMLFGDCSWWGGQGGQWGPFDLKDDPVVEVKWRGDSFQFYDGVQTASGQRSEGGARGAVAGFEQGAAGMPEDA